ncbi:hypothetical protein TNCV_3782601 [Trichonephila clavipes]|nr:hypothetical protein TNCV_3782601 [Trichonephila clavipes]
MGRRETTLMIVTFVPVLSIDITANIESLYLVWILFHWPYTSFLMDLIFQSLCLQLSCKKCPGIYEAKLTEGIFFGPDICKHMEDKTFVTSLTEKEKKA